METLTGACHCGAVRFQVRAIAPGLIDCNCSICRKKGFLHLIVSQADFTLLSGEDALSTYQFNTGVAEHRFCRICGIHPFYRPRSHPDGISVNARCLDDQAAVAAMPCQPFDGKNWEANIDHIR